MYSRAHVLLVTIIIFINFGLLHYVRGDKPNVLFIVVDDLRPALGCYGEKVVLSPNIDQLASKSVKFNNAYVQQAVCGPSRTSFLTSRRPDTTRLYDFGSYWRKVAGNYTTLPEYFKVNGYHAQSVGKVFHPGISSGHHDDSPYSWSNKAYHPPTQANKMAKVCKAPWDKKLHVNVICPVNVTQQPGGSLPDIQSAQYAVSFLKNVSSGQIQKPFFLAVGFHKPHLPFKYPEKYLSLYPMSSIHLAPYHTLPPGMPKVAWNMWAMSNRDDIQRLNLSWPYGPMPTQFQYKMRQAYYATTTYMDDLVGHLLSTLDSLGLANNTIVSLHGDHGWSLGEHQEWAKFSNFEVAVRIPMMTYIPGLTHAKQPAGQTFPYRDPFHVDHQQHTQSKDHSYASDVFENQALDRLSDPESTHAKFDSGDSNAFETNALVEAIDLFPSLVDLAGLKPIPTCPEPSNKIDLCTEGHSFADVIHNVTRVPKNGQQIKLGKWKSAVFSQYPRASYYPNHESYPTPLKHIEIMGYSMRTDNLRYTEWVHFNHSCFCGNWKEVYARELYMHDTDPGENENKAYEQGYENIIVAAADQLHKGWRHALPPSTR